MMKKLFREFRKHLDGSDMAAQAMGLCRIELGQTSRHQRMAAEFIRDRMRRAGLPHVEILSFPADGTTVYEDKRMPFAWDATVGKLTLFDEEKTVAADYSKNPFNLIHGSTAAKPEGETVRIITEPQFLAGEDPRNALVILENGTAPRAKVLKPVLDQGGRGIIASFMSSRYDFPDDVQWVIACTEGDHWHVQCDDRDFIGFSVDLRTGEKIRQLANAGGLKARIECDGRRYAGELPAATALIPGRKKEEVWLFAHAFEPLLDDDAVGVAACIEAAKQIMEQGVPEYSLRLIFTMELYGYAAFHAGFKGKVIGGINLDYLPSVKGETCSLIPPICGCPFHGIGILKEIAEEWKEGRDTGPASPDSAVQCVLEKPECFDDMCLSDTTAGVPTVWFIKRKSSPGLWHSSAQNRMDRLSPDLIRDYTALACVWLYRTLFYTGAPAVRKPLTVKPVSSPWRDHAAKQIYARTQPGLPYDLVRIPKEKRRTLPDNIIYGPMGSLLSAMDGRKDMAQIILETEADRQITLNDEQIRKYLDAVNYLADWGYLAPLKRTALTRRMLADALKKLGVKKGDLLLVHASASRCGYVQDGPETLIRGILDAVGPEGTALFPTFTRPYLMLGTEWNKCWDFRPYDAHDPSRIWTGLVPQILLEKFPDAVRSRHITHSWAGLGPGTGECLSAHKPADPPACRRSPLGKALEAGGKVLYLGTGLAPSTFLHFIETENHAKFLQPAVCRVKEDGGSLRTVWIEQHLPGHRDFYRRDAETCKFFTRAVKAGLTIHEIPFGMNKLQMIDLKEFYKIGMRLWKEDPRILLCDDPECMFCKQF